MGAKVNLERAMQMNARLDGHLVQGHVDVVGVCTKQAKLRAVGYFPLNIPKR